MSAAVGQSIAVALRAHTSRPRSTVTDGTGLVARHFHRHPAAHHRLFPAQHDLEAETGAGDRRSFDGSRRSSGRSDPSLHWKKASRFRNRQGRLLDLWRRFPPPEPRFGGRGRARCRRNADAPGRSASDRLRESAPGPVRCRCRGPSAPGAGRRSFGLNVGVVRHAENGIVIPFRHWHTIISERNDSKT